MADQQLIEDDPDGVDISALIQRFAAPLFGGHVGGGAGDVLATHHAVATIARAGRQVEFQPGVLGELGQAKVGDLGQAALGDENVFGFEVAMDQAGAFGLGVAQAITDVDGDF